MSISDAHADFHSSVVLRQFLSAAKLALKRLALLAIV
jgi:hypothetical protein